MLLKWLLLAVALKAEQCVRPFGTGKRGSPQPHLLSNVF